MSAQHNQPLQLNPYYWVGAAFQAAAESERRNYARQLTHSARDGEEPSQPAPKESPGWLAGIIASLRNIWHGNVAAVQRPRDSVA